MRTLPVGVVERQANRDYQEDSGVPNPDLVRDFLHSNREAWQWQFDAGRSAVGRADRADNTTISRSQGAFRHLDVHLDNEGHGTISLRMDAGKNNLPLWQKLFKKAGTGQVTFKVGEPGVADSGVISQEVLSDIQRVFQSGSSDSKMLEEVIALVSRFDLTRNMVVENLQLQDLMLAGLDLSEAEFHRVRLKQVNLDFVDGSQMVLEDVLFQKCQAAHFNLSDAQVGIKCGFFETDLCTANLSNTQIRAKIRINNSDIRGCDLSNNTVLKNLLLYGSDREILKALDGTLYDELSTRFSNDPDEQRVIMERARKLSQRVNCGSHELTARRIVDDLTKSPLTPTLEREVDAVDGKRRTVVVPLADFGALELFPASSTDSELQRVRMLRRDGIARSSIDEPRKKDYSPEAAAEEILRVVRKKNRRRAESAA